MAEEFQTVDELDAGVVAALERHGEEAARALGANGRDAVVIGRGGQARIGDVIDSRMRFQPAGHGHGVFHMALHAQAEGFDPHQRVMGRLRVHGHAQIAQADGDAVEGEGEGPERLVEFEAVIGGLRGRERGELVGGRPVELARIDDGAACDGAVAGQVFRGRMHHQRGPVFDGAAEVGGGRGVVHDQRQASGIRDRADRVQIGDIAARIGDGFAEDRARVVVDGGLDRVQIVEIDKGRGPAEAFDRLAELRDRAAIETGRGHDVAARSHQREKRHDLRRVPRRAADSPDAAFQRGDAFLQHGHGRVGQARVDIAHFLQVEQSGGVIGVAEDIGRGLVDRRLARAGGGIRPAAGVNLQGIKAVAGCICH